MKRTINAKIIWLLLLLIVIMVASTTFGTFEPFITTMPSIQPKMTVS